MGELGNEQGMGDDGDNDCLCRKGNTGLEKGMHRVTLGLELLSVFVND